MKTLLKRIYLSRQLFIFSSTLFFWALIYVINPGNKLLTVLIFSFILFFSYRFKNLRLGVGLGFILCLPIVVGKIYSFETIPAGVLWQSFYPQGYFETIVIKPINLVTGVMALILLRDLALKKSFPPIKNGIFLLFGFLFIGASSIFFSLNPEFSLIIFIELLQIPILFIYLTVYLSKQKNLSDIFVGAFSATFIALFGLTLLQFLKGSRVGLAVEISPQEILSPANFEEIFIQFRPFATFYHANALAAFSLPFFPFFLVHTFLTKSKITLAAFVSTTGIIFLALGRSAWLSGILGLLAALYWIEIRLSTNMLKSLVKRVKYFIVPLSGLLLLGGYLVFPRIVSTFGAFQESGSAYVRLLQTKEALETISRFPTFGIGLGMSVVYFYQNIQGSSVLAFPSQTHNGYLQLAVETGIPAFILIVGFIFVNLYKILNAANGLAKHNKNISALAFSLAAGTFGILINAFFQPYLVQHREPHFEMIVLVLFLGLYYVSTAARVTKNNGD